MPKWFYYNENGDKIEVTGGQLKGLAKAGMITPNTIVENEEGKTAPARKVKGLTFGEATPSEPSQSTATPPISVNWYYYDAKGKKVGPVPFSVLQSLAENGVISPGTAVESENGQAAIAGKIEGLIFAESQSPPEPVPAVPPETFNISDAFNAAMNAPVEGGNVPTNTPPYSQFTVEEQAEIDRFIAEFGSDVNAVGNSGLSLLHTAIVCRTMDNRGFQTDAVARYLVSKGADVNAKDENGITPLGMAVVAKQFEIARYLVSQGANVNVAACGTTLLTAAIMSEQFELTKLLISKGADVNVADVKVGNDNLPPIAVAVGQGNIEMVKLLISSGANVNVRGENGATLLDLAKGKGHTAIVQYLSSLPIFPSKAAPLATPPHSQFTAEEQAEIDRFMNLFGSVAETMGGNKLNRLLLLNRLLFLALRKVGGQDTTLAVFKYLVSQGANVNAKDDDDCTPLYYAVAEGRIDVTKYLLSQGSDVNTQADTKGGIVTPIVLAVVAGNIEMAKVLISQGADVNGCSAGVPLIGHAVVKGNVEMAKVLISLGADAHWRHPNGKTMIDIARHNGQTAMVQYLSSLSATPNSLPNAPPVSTSQPYAPPTHGHQPVATGFWTTLTTKSVTLTQSKQKAKILWGIFWSSLALTGFVAMYSFGNMDTNTDPINAIIPIIFPAFLMLVFLIWAAVESGGQSTACPKCERLDADQVVREEALKKEKKMETRTKTTSINHASGKTSYINTEYQVPVTVHYIGRHHQCKFCQHTWQDVTTRTTDGWD